MTAYTQRRRSASPNPEGRDGRAARAWLLAALGSVGIALVARSSAWADRVPAAPVVDPITREARVAVMPERAVLLGIARAGARLVAVGERGIIVLSDDSAATWRQAAVPTSVSLTAVAFADRKSGWAVGHSGIILHTVDAGRSWTRQLDGRTAARAALADALAHDGPQAAGYVHLAKQLVADGPDAPFLALHVADRSHALAVGANGLFFGTSDAGRTWHPRMAAIANPRGLHYYGVDVRGNDVTLAGEAGLVERSRDGGKTFAPVAVPYRGTFFDLASPRPGQLALVGLRGNFYLRSDGATRFHRIRTPLSAALSAIAPLADGSYIVGTQSGALLRWRPGDERAAIVPAPPLPPIAGIVQAADGSIVTVGFAGAVRLALGDVR